MGATRRDLGQPRTCGKQAGGYRSLREHAWGREATHTHGLAKGQLPARQPAEATQGDVNTTGGRAVARRVMDGKGVRNDKAYREGRRPAGEATVLIREHRGRTYRHPQDNEQR